MIVVDASVVIDLITPAPGSASLRDRVLGRAAVLSAPHLLDLEVAQVLRRLLGGGILSEALAADCLALHTALPLVRYPHHPHLRRIWQLRANLTAYDAAYVALAEAHDAPLLTRDARIARAPGLRARVEVV